MCLCVCACVCACACVCVCTCVCVCVCECVCVFVCVCVCSSPSVSASAASSSLTSWYRPRHYHPLLPRSLLIRGWSWSCPSKLVEIYTWRSAVRPTRPSFQHAWRTGCRSDPSVLCHHLAPPHTTLTASCCAEGASLS